MPRTASLLAGLALLIPNVYPAPFYYYIEERCSCQPLPAGNSGSSSSSNDSASLAECQLVAARLQTTRAQARKLPFLTDVWVDDNKVLHVDVPSRRPARVENLPVIVTAATSDDVDDVDDDDDDDDEEEDPVPWSAAFTSAIERLPWRWAHSHAQSPPEDAEEKPCHSRDQRQQRKRRRQRQQDTIPSPAVRANVIATAAAETAETEKQGYSIVCAARALPHTFQEQRLRTLISLGPLPLLFVFLAMILACTTLVDCVLQTWQRYAAVRVRLDGPEMRIYALPQEEREQEQERGEETGDVDEKYGASPREREGDRS